MSYRSLQTSPILFALILSGLALADISDAGRYSFNASPMPNYSFFSSHRLGYSFNVGPEVSRMDLNGMTWNGPIRITQSSDIDERPSIIETPSFGPLQIMTKWVFWHSRSSSSGSPNNIYYVNCYDSKGQSWTTQQTLTSSGYEYRPTPAIARYGGPYSLWLAWASLRDQVSFDIYYKLFSEIAPYDWQWSIDNRLAPCNSGKPDLDPAIIQASDGKIWIAWASNDGTSSDPNYNIHLAYSDGGASWVCLPQMILDDGGDEMYPSLAEISEDGYKRILIAYHSNRDSVNPYLNEIYCQKWDPVAQCFTKLSRITSNTVQDEHPSVMLKENGDIWIAWDSEGEIYYAISHSGGFTWTGPVNITNLQGIDETPWITQTWNGIVWVVWSTNRDGNFEIYAMYGI